MNLWPHQERALDELKAAIADGEQSILLTCPTGGGKTRMAQEAILWALATRNWNSVLYSNRKMLLEQTSKVLDRSDIVHGLRASGHQAELMQKVQLSSIQTERSRVYTKEQWSLHPAKLVLIDEAHVNGNGTAEQIIRDHREMGAFTVGLTATPLDLGHLYERLIVAGTMSELRECGALVPAIHYGPDEPDLRHIEKIKVQASGEFSENEIRKVFKIQKVFGRIVEWYKKLNPTGLPAILFAPGVQDSVWCAQNFIHHGISAAHIDGESIWMNGEQMESTPEAREELKAKSESGEIKVVCNRFVMREGIDWPWLSHAILATVFGGVQSYIQSVGRILRAYPGKTKSVIQDHGSSWHRHGSINADRDWQLSDTNRIVTGVRIDSLREKKLSEPIVCPKCSAVRNAGKQCPVCEFESPLRKRTIIQVNGEPKEMHGDIYRSRRRVRTQDSERLWERMYHRGLARCKKGDGASFIALEALFAYENGWAWPTRDLPLMPRDSYDWFLPVNLVPRERLISSREPGAEG